MPFNSTLTGQGACPSPFLEANLFPEKKGFIRGRFCSELQGINCCLPCPHAQWLYSDNLEPMLEWASWMNLPGLLCSMFLIASFFALPTSKTNRHYLNVCLVTSIPIMNIAFLIPLAVKPGQCIDAITPNDMRSNTTCALSGALVIAGGWLGVMWVFLITLALHLQICWQLKVGKNFMWGAITAGCMIPSIGLTVALGLSGVSFRFGSTCHVNAENSLISLWAPLLLIASLTLFMQLATFIYCLRVYFTSLSNIPTTLANSTHGWLRNKLNILIHKEAFQSIPGFFKIQWRSVLIVLVIVCDVIFFAIVFVSLNQVESALAKGNDNFTSWLNCLIETAGNKEECLLNAKIPRISEGTVISVLVLLSVRFPLVDAGLNGFWCLLLLGRFSMVTGWLDLLSGKKREDFEFITTDMQRSKRSTDYEMLGNMSDQGKSPDTLISQPETALLRSGDY